MYWWLASVNQKEIADQGYQNVVEGTCRPKLCQWDYLFNVNKSCYPNTYFSGGVERYLSKTECNFSGIRIKLLI